MSDDVLKVAADLLMQAGRDEEARWLLNPDAVRTLLRSPATATDSPVDSLCYACRQYTSPSDPEADEAYWWQSALHRPDCAVFAAWMALHDKRAREEIDRAWDEALGLRRLDMEPDACEHRFVSFTTGLDGQPTTRCAACGEDRSASFQVRRV